METATVDVAEAARPHPAMVMELVTAGPASGMDTSVPLVAVQPLGGGGVLPPQVGSSDCAGTLTAFHAALTVLNSVQPLGKRLFAACSVHTRYRRYDDAVVFRSIALYM